jgi:2-methylcitrate dehydratase
MATTTSQSSPPDPVITAITDYVAGTPISNRSAYDTARWCLLDSLGCAMLALNIPACTKLLGPVVPGAVLPGGARVPGTDHELDPVKAAFDIGTLVRWLDYNNT